MTTTTTTTTTTTETTTVEITTEAPTSAPVAVASSKQTIVLPIAIVLLMIVMFQMTTTADTVYIGKTGTKYHRQGCRTLKGNGSPISLSEAKAQGREACKICKP